MLTGLTSIPRGSADITDAIASALGIRPSQAERLKCVAGSAIASPTDNREMVAIARAEEDGHAPLAYGADENNCIPRAELISVITGELDVLMGDVARALEGMGFAVRSKPSRARQVVLTGGGAELAGIADYAQGLLGVPVRIGRPPQLRGLPEAHAVPGFTTLTGLVLYAAEDPVDIRVVSKGYTLAHRPTGFAMARRALTAMREYF
jgi:cell division protein FtsA